MEYGVYDKEMVEAARKEAAYTAKRIAGSFGFTYEDREDLEQELNLAVIKKANTLDSARGSIHTFVVAVIKGKSLTELRRRRRKAKREKTILCLHNETVDGDDVVAYHETLDRSVCMNRMGRDETDPILLSDLRHDVEVVLKLFTPKQKRICRLLMETDKKTAAHRMGVSRQTLYREIEAIRQIMSEIGINAYRGIV